MIKYYCTNRNSSFKETVKNIIKFRKEEILNFFNINLECELEFSVYIYDSIEDLINGMSHRGFEKMPDYMCACFKDEDNSLNFFEPKDNPSENEWSKEEYETVVFHELVHAIQFMIYGSQPEWLTEGIAKYLDGTYKSGIKSLMENYILKNQIPSMYELEYEFGMHEYDSYDYAYLIVSYLIETLEKEKFLEIISDKENLIIISRDILNKAISYYNVKYFSMDK